LPDKTVVFLTVGPHERAYAIREEITEALEAWAGYFEPTIIEPGSPLYEDLKDIEQRSQEGRLKFYTYDEVFGK
jgi:hypothetical protein